VPESQPLGVLGDVVPDERRIASAEKGAAQRRTSSSCRTQRCMPVATSQLPVDRSTTAPRGPDGLESLAAAARDGSIGPPPVEQREFHTCSEDAPRLPDDRERAPCTARSRCKVDPRSVAIT